MKKYAYFTFLIIFLLTFNTICYATAGMEVDKNVVITNNPTRFANLIPYKDIQPLAKGYIDVTKGPYFAAGDGVTDDTQKIQNAINDARDGNFVVFFPGDKVYLVSNQLNCIRTADDANASRKFGIQMMGSTKGKKPVIKLKDGSTVTGKIVVFYDAVFTTTTGGVITASVSDDSRHYVSHYRGIDIDMGNNSTVSALSMSGAQYCSIEDVNIYSSSTAPGAHFNAGISDLPGSGGFTANVSVDGGNYGILQNSYRPNPTVTGVTLTNQLVSGIRLLNTRGPLVVTGFKIVSPAAPSAGYNAIYANCAGSNPANVQASLCLTDGSIEILGSTSRTAIYNFDQSVALNNVFVKSGTVISSGSPAQILAGSINDWEKISNYIFTTLSDNSTVYADFVKLNNQTANYQLNDLLVNISQPSADLVSRHVWASMPSWEDTNLVDITAYGATPENVNATDDDRAAIQAAIDDVTNPTSLNFGKSVFIPRGHFHISGPLNFKSGLKIIGAGKTISAIQGLNDRVYGAIPMIQTADDANGSLVMSDFAIIPYPNITFLNIRTNNTILRDIVTEAVASTKYVYPGSAHWLNNPGVPYLLFSGNAGGQIHGICTDQIATASVVEANPPVPGYHFMDVTSRLHQLNFYQFSSEHIENSPQILISNAKNVTIFGLKHECHQELVDITNSDSIQIIGGSGNTTLDRADYKALIVIKNSKNILIQNICRKPPGTPDDIAKFWIKSEKDSVSAAYGVLSYSIGNISLTALNNPIYNKSGSDLKVYTNDKTKELIIDGISANEMIEIYNAIGVKVLAVRNTEEQVAHINIGKLLSGIYVVKINNEAVKFLKNF